MIRAIWHSLPPAVRYPIRDRLKGVAEAGRQAALWSWTRWTLPAPTGGSEAVSYLGEFRFSSLAAQAFGDPGASPEGGDGEGAEGTRRVGLTVRQLGLPGDLRIPVFVRPVLDLTPPFETVLARGSARIWRYARRLAERATLVTVTEDREVERVSAELLTPYAARHTDGACQVPLETIRQLASEGGLTVVRVDGEEVAARLGYSYRAGGKRYFQAWRFGYPSSVVDAPKRYGEVSSLNLYLTIQQAKESGHDALDLGISHGCPAENGQLQFKRERGAAVSVLNCHSFFFVRIDPACSARFLWARPQLSVERRQVVLNLGLPANVTEEELVERIRRKLVFRGIATLRLHAEREVDPQAIPAIRECWNVNGDPSSRGSGPQVVVVRTPDVACRYSTATPN